MRNLDEMIIGNTHSSLPNTYTKRKRVLETKKAKSITKLKISSLYFVSEIRYQHRIINLGVNKTVSIDLTPKVGTKIF